MTVWEEIRQSARATANEVVRERLAWWTRGVTLSEAARRLGVDRANLRRELRRLGMRGDAK